MRTAYWYQECKIVCPVYTGRAIPRHVKDNRASVENNRVLIKPGVIGPITQQLVSVVKLHRHNMEMCVIDSCSGLWRLYGQELVLTDCT